MGAITVSKAKKTKKPFLGGLFKAKPGGTMVGNLLRGGIGAFTGITLQPPQPAIDTIGTNNYRPDSDTQEAIKNKAASVGEIATDLRNLLKTGTNFQKSSKTANTVMIIAAAFFGLIALKIISKK